MMKRIPALAVMAAALLLAGCGGDKEEVASSPEGGWTGGGELTLAEATPLTEITAKSADFVGSAVRLEGEVVAVCQGTGCWIEIADAEGNKFYVRSMDESILFPKDCTGKRAQVQGEVIALQPAGHEEHEEGEEGDHYCPEPTYLLDVKGAKLL